MTLRSLIVLGLCAASLSACNNSDDAVSQDEVAAPAPVLTPAPQATVAADGTALETGTWIVTEDATGARAAFGEAGQPSKLAINCETISGTVTLDIAGASQTPEAWRIDAGGEAARLDMSPVEGGLTAAIEQSLAIFHAFSETGGVFVLTNPMGARMQFPTHPGISRVLDACS